MAGGGREGGREGGWEGGKGRKGETLRKHEEREKTLKVYLIPNPIFVLC